MATMNKMCRLCMGRSNLNHTVLEEQFLQKIAICVSLLINPEDKSLPLELCVLCALKVKDFYEFRQNCLEVQRLLKQARPAVETRPVEEPQIVQKQEPLVEPDVQDAVDDEIATLATADEPEDVEENSIDKVGESLVETDAVFEDRIEDCFEFPEEGDPETDSKYELVESDYELIADDLSESFQEDACEEAVIEYLSYDESSQDQSEVGVVAIEIKTETKPPKKPAVTNRKRKPGVSKKDRDEKEIYQSLLLNCETCGKTVERNRMEGHRNRHEGVRPYKCPVWDCGIDFHCKISLRLHFNNRHSSNQFPCDVCSKVYNSQKTLYHHKRESHSEKRFKCDQCEQMFVTNARLNRHKITHTDVRDFKCPHCPKEFHRSNNLKVHLRSHTKEKPFACGFCDKAFGYQRLLKSHLVRNHPDA